MSGPHIIKDGEIEAALRLLRMRVRSHWALSPDDPLPEWFTEAETSLKEGDYESAYQVLNNQHSVLAEMDLPLAGLTTGLCNVLRHLFTNYDPMIGPPDCVA